MLRNVTTTKNFNKKVLEKLYDFSGGRTKTKDLKPFVQLLFKFLTSNLMPKKATHLG
jgi:hypothetical protein